MHKWDSHTKMNPLPFLELILILGVIMALILLPGVTEWAYSIGRMIIQ